MAASCTRRSTGLSAAVLARKGPMAPFCASNYGTWAHQSQAVTWGLTALISFLTSFALSCSSMHPVSCVLARQTLAARAAA